jgi:hypothetical protein
MIGSILRSVNKWPTSVQNNDYTNNNNNEESKHEITAFMDQGATWWHAPEAQPDSTFSVAETPETIDGFLRRPLLIETIQWAVQTSMNVTFNPWSLFFTNPQVARKIRNFKLLRCNLHLRMLVNGNPFYFGRALASYRPLAVDDDSFRYDASSNADLMEMSQRPNITLDPTDSTGGGMDLPFFWYNNALDIPSADWDRMGSVDIVDLVTLRNANDVTNPISISVYAWATDVHISQPTSSALPDPQSEFDGPISGPASKIARVSGMLSKAPVIGPYALATEMISSAVGKVASVFGFSKPYITDEYTPIADRPLQYATTSNAKSSAMPLSLDVKKQVTIDPRTTGLGSTDELSFAHLASRESFVTKFNWDQSASSGSLLYNFRVTPTINSRDPDGNIHMIPAGFVATPFSYWRGTMIYTFTVVASKYHKGRLRIVYDPSYQETDETNVNRQEVMDITDVHQFEMKVGWGQQSTYLRVPSLVDGEYHSANRIGSPLLSCNGTISVYVLNDLTSARESLDPIEIMVHARAADDFEVAGPSELNLQLIELAPLVPGSGPGAGFPTRTLPGRALHTPTAGGNFLRWQDLSLPNTESNPSIETTRIWNEIYTNGNIVTPASQLIRVPIERADGDDATRTIYLRVRCQGSTNDIVEYSVAGPLNTEVLATGTTVPITGVMVFGVDMSTMPVGFSYLDLTATIDGTARAYLEIDEVTTLISSDTSYQLIEPNDTDYYSLGGASSIDQGCFLIPPGSTVTFSSRGQIVADTNFEFYTNDATVTANGSTFDLPGGVLKWRTLTGLTDGVTEILVTNNGPDDARLSSIDFLYENDMEFQSAVEAHSAVQDTVGSTSMPADPNVIYFGENIPSFRPLMKRPEGYTVIGPDPVVANDLTNSIVEMPLTGENVGRAGFFGLTLIEYVRRAYLGERGAIRLTCYGPLIHTNGSIRAYGTVQADRLESYGGFSETEYSLSALIPAMSLSGTAYAKMSSHAEFDIPWYSRFRFAPTRKAEYTDNDAEYLARSAVRIITTSVINMLTVNRSAGEDYNVFFFLNTPIVREAS